MTPDQLAGTSEHSQQRAFFAWAAMAQRFGFAAAWDDKCYKEASWAYRNYGQLEAVEDLKWIHAIKNAEKGGGDRKTNAIRGLANKAEGVKPGVADIFWPKPLLVVINGSSFILKAGLYIEMKKIKGGKIEDEQIAFKKYVEGKGYAHRFALGWKTAAKVCETYERGALSGDAFVEDDTWALGR